MLKFGGEFPYVDKTSYVFSCQTDAAKTQYIQYVTNDAVDFVTDLEQKEAKDTWLAPGARGSENLLFRSKYLIAG